MSASFNRASYISPLSGKTPIITPSRDLTASSFIKKICLYDWWLVNGKDESNRGILRVSGIGSKDGQFKRVFNSAAISKRCDMVTLEAVDGFMITLTGFINRSVTQDNGFTAEVCNCFRFGFPVNWKDYASFDENNINPSVTRELWSLPMPMDDMPVTLIRDILVSGRGGGGGCSIQMKLEKNAFDDLVQISGEGIVSNKNVTQSETRKVPKKKVLKTRRGCGGVVTRSMSKQNRLEKENQVLDKAENQVLDKAGNQVFDKAENQVFDKAGNQVLNKAGNQVFDKAENHVFDKAENQVLDKAGNQVFDNTMISDSKRGRKDDYRRNESRKRLNVDLSSNNDGVEGMVSVRRSSRIKALGN